jgi:hypothetical protein
VSIGYIINIGKLKGIKMDWTEAMIELNSLLETIRDETIVTKQEVLQEVDNVFGKEDKT